MYVAVLELIGGKVASSAVLDTLAHTQTKVFEVSSCTPTGDHMHAGLYMHVHTHTLE